MLVIVAVCVDVEVDAVFEFVPPRVGRNEVLFLSRLFVWVLPHYGRAWIDAQYIYGPRYAGTGREGSTRVYTAKVMESGGGWIYTERC